MSEQQTHWTEVNYSESRTLTPEIQYRREIFEIFMRTVDSEESLKVAISFVEQLTQSSEHVGRLALIDNPELSDTDRIAK
jgi:hypothetical protein